MTATGQIISGAFSSIGDSLDQMASPRTWAKEKLHTVTSMRRRFFQHLRHKFSSKTKRRANTVTSHVRRAGFLMEN